MTKVEDLEGIQGSFEGGLKDHPNPKFRLRRLAYGTVTYPREVGGEIQEVTIPVNGVIVKRLQGPGLINFRRYIRVERGPKGNRDKIIGLIDKE